MAFDIKEDKVKDAIAAMKTFNMRGCNVTMPDKVEAAKYMDELSPAAQIIGAVNTIVNDNGKLTGHITDGEGFVHNLRDHGIEIKGKKITVVPILRAGLGMMDGVLENVPRARISVVGMYRNEETLEPVPYFQKLVSNIDERMALIVDPMLATGGSVIATIDLLKKAGCSSIKVLVLVAAPEGIAALEKAHPDVELYTASIDQGLNEHGYIIPGLGDAGDKIFGTK